MLLCSTQGRVCTCFGRLTSLYVLYSLPTQSFIHTIKIFGLVINSAYYRCSSCSDKHHIFGSLDSAYRAVEELGLDTSGKSSPLGELPMVSEVSKLGDQGKLGEVFLGDRLVTQVSALKEVRTVMENIANHVWGELDRGTLQ